MLLELGRSVPITVGSPAAWALPSQDRFRAPGLLPTTEASRRATRQNQPVAARVIAATVPVVVLHVASPIGAAWILLAVAVGLDGRGGQVMLVAYPLSIVAAIAVGGLVDPDNAAAFSSLLILVEAPLVIVGWVLGRLRRVARQRARQRRIAAEQARVAALVSAERRRIADDLGAVVLDELRRVAELAAGLRAAVSLGPPEAALAELQQAARRALAAMRRVLTVLRADADAPGPPVVTPMRWWEPRPPSRSGLVVASVAAVLVLGVAALRLPPVVDPITHRSLDVFGLPVDRPVPLALLVLEIAGLACGGRRRCRRWS
jgi:hypothetical protein